jgi:hypothetical protein
MRMACFRTGSREAKVEIMASRSARETLRNTKSNHKLCGSVAAGAQCLAEKDERGTEDWTKGQRKEGVKEEKKGAF